MSIAIGPEISTFETRVVASAGHCPAAIHDQQALRICASLHRGLSLDEARAGIQWTPGETASTLRALQQAGLLAQTPDGSYKPAAMIITRYDAATRLPVHRTLIDEAVRLAVAQLPRLHRQRVRLRAFRKLPFERLSLFLLSNVLFDNWQIRNIEQDLLGSGERPRGGQGWLALIERGGFDGLGNSEFSLGPFTFCVYGRGGAEIQSAAGQLDEDSPAARQLIELLSGDRINKGRPLKNSERCALARMGLYDRGNLNLFLLQPDEAYGLQETADLIRADLSELLHRRKNQLRRAYEASSYAREIVFNEYFVWWYHCFYTAVSYRLAQLGYIYMPASGACAYAIAG